MIKPYLVMVNNALAARHLTRTGAIKHIEKLQARNIRAVLAYEPENLLNNSMEAYNE